MASSNLPVAWSKKSKAFLSDASTQVSFMYSVFGGKV